MNIQSTGSSSGQLPAPQNTRLCTHHAVQSASRYASPVRRMDCLGKGEVLTNMDFNKLKKINNGLFVCMTNNVKSISASTETLGAKTEVLHVYFC